MDDIKKHIALLKETIVTFKITVLRNHLMALQCVLKQTSNPCFHCGTEHLCLLRKGWVFLMADFKTVSWSILCLLSHSSLHRQFWHFISNHSLLYLNTKWCMKIPGILPYSTDDKSLQKGHNLLQPINREIFSVQNLLPLTWIYLLEASFFLLQLY